MIPPRCLPGLLPALIALVLSASPSRADLIHRWSFNGVSGTVSGTSFADSIQGTPLVLRGNGATLTGTPVTAVTLPGSSTGVANGNTISAYLDLPNGLLSARTSVTIEAWVTPVSSQSWQRLFDFGASGSTFGSGAVTGEILDVAASTPSSYTPSEGLFLSLNNGGTLGNQRLRGQRGGTTWTIDTNLSGSTTAGTEYHYALTIDDGLGVFGPNGARARWYRNGTLHATLDLPFRLPEMRDVNNWIGRSSTGADRGSNITINELRIHNEALTAAQIAASVAAGPNPTYTTPVAVADAVTMHRGQKVRVPVLANDTGSTSAPTVRVLTAPAFGTAVPDADGGILYTHTTGLPTTDSFTYDVSGPAGRSGVATVTITFSDALRFANPRLNVPSTPPATAFQLVDAFPNLTFSAPICLRTVPGDTRRLFVVERAGTLRLIPDVTVPTPASVSVFTLANLIAGRTPAETISTASENGFLSVALHPNFNTNGFVYLFYSVQFNSLPGTPIFQRISRVTLANPSSNAPTLVAGSEVILIQQVDDATNHNGGDMHFGPDGYLYISLGDEGGQNDQFNNSQRLDKDFLAGILRIDVDKRPGNLEPNAHPNPVEYPTNPPPDAVIRNAGVANYSIPLDNPWVHTSLGGSWNGSFNGSPVSNLAYVRSEFFAVGLRNPWRFSFDPQTGEGWIADVGGGQREEISILARGANYGWAFREGFVNGPKSGQAPTNFNTLFHAAPIYDYLRTGTGLHGTSVTGGVVYRGTRFPGLTGAYIFVDYVSGNLWSLRRTPAIDVQRLTGESSIAAFGYDPSNGDVLAANLSTGRLRRLVVETPVDSFPPRLSATNLFADLSDLSPSPSVLPYTVNLPFWSDHALKRRWFTIPDGTSRMTWARDGEWTFPSGTVWVKHFDLELTRGNPATRKRLETRLLVRNATGAYGVSYRWNDAGTDAVLVADAGDDFTVPVTVGSTPYNQQWRIPSRAECLACHTPAAGHALSFNTRQLNLSNPIHHLVGNQLTILHQGGCFSNVPESPNVLPRHVRPDETAFSLEARARSYIDVNCAYCHQAGGTGAPAVWDGRAELRLDATGLINGLVSNNGGNALNRLVVPGNLANSVLVHRTAQTNGFTRMPPIGSNEIDQAGVTLLQDWIRDALPGRQTFTDWRLARFGSATSPEGAPTVDPDADGATNEAEFIAGTQPQNGGSVLRPQLSVTGGAVTLSLQVPANRSFQILTSTDLVNWSLWDVPGNQGLPSNGSPISITAPVSGDRRFFRAVLREN